MKAKSGKRGRPKSDRDDDGEIKRDGSVLVRALIVLADFNKARHGGMTVRAARQFVVAEHKRIFPAARISVTEVARILAEFQPEDNKEAFVATRSGNNKIGFGFGQRPNFSRKPSISATLRYGKKPKPKA